LKILAMSSEKKWTPLEAPADAGQPEQNAVKACAERFDRSLVELLLSENLVVLCGLGTTQCVLDTVGNRIAPRMQDLWEASKDKAGQSFNRILAKARYSTEADGEEIETLLSHCQLSQALKADRVIQRFIDDTEAIIVEKCRFVTEATQLSVHEAFIRRVARRSTRQPRLKVFTTNYDLCFETAASHLRFVVVDGFSHTEPREFDGGYFNYDFVRRERDRDVPEYIPNVFHLYKMHGSVDWEQKGAQIVRSAQARKPRIVFPRYGKFESSYEQPFLEMMSRFQSSLREPNTGLLIAGSGFRDPHIAQPILSALESNVGLKAMIVDPALENSSVPAIAKCASLIEAGDSRLTLVAAGFEDLVSKIPDLVATTESEEHQARLRTIGGVN